MNLRKELVLFQNSLIVFFLNILLNYFYIHKLIKVKMVLFIHFNLSDLIIALINIFFYLINDAC